MNEINMLQKKVKLLEEVLSDIYLATCHMEPVYRIKKKEYVRLVLDINSLAYNTRLDLLRMEKEENDNV